MRIECPTRAAVILSERNESKDLLLAMLRIGWEIAKLIRPCSFKPQGERLFPQEPFAGKIMNVVGL